MRIRVLLFGPEAALVGSRSVDVDLPVAEAATCAALRRALAESIPGLTRAMSSSRLAVNHAFASDECVILAEDEVALIGPVSGG